MVSTEVPVTADGTYVDKIKEGVPIPEGFYYVGGTKNTGVVISDAAADENTTNTTVAENLTGNQYVWVPVLQNQKLKIEVASEAEITDITIGGPSSMITTDKNGNTITPSGTSYTVEVNPTINGAYVVTAKAGEELAETEVLTVSSLYAQKDFEGTKAFLDALLQLEAVAESQNMTVDKLLESGAVASQYPGLTSVAMGPQYIYAAYGFSNFTDSSIATYKDSVNTYGGFYIARYEAGSENNRYDNKTSTTVYSQKNKYPFNFVTQEEAITLSQAIDTGKTSITSDLTNAAAWDRTLNWLVETSAITVNETTDELADSTGWGNYSNSEFNFTGKYSIDYGNNFTDTTTSTAKQTYADSNKYYLLGTGVSNYTKRNNIYDLAGNCYEWTTEAGSSDYVVYRGGYYHSEGFDDPAKNRLDGASATYSLDNGSFRPTLYINYAE